MKVLVCDDQKGEDIIGAIQKANQGIEILPLVGPRLTDALVKLFKRVDKILQDPKAYRAVTDLPFDAVDVVVLDNNLAHLLIEGTRLTAESIAGYVRAFTTSRYIVSLNKNLEVDFDLRYLVGDYATRADVALNTSHLTNPGLWTGKQADAIDGFLPWYWPKLSAAANRRSAQIDFVRQHLDDSVLAVLGFDDEAIGFLSLHAKGALTPEAESDGNGKGGVPINKVTFRDVFLAKDRSLPARKERDNLSEAERAGSADIRDIITRVVAADMELWLRRDVIGPQEALVDIPHLLMRFPFLLGNRANDIKEWNKSIGERTAPFGLEKALFENHLVNTKFGNDAWVFAPTFWWPKLKADEKLQECFFKAKKGEWADLVFCEDRSAFLERSPNGGAAPTEFSAEFEGSWGRRYVARIPNIRYAPFSRFAV